MQTRLAPYAFLPVQKHKQRAWNNLMVLNNKLKSGQEYLKQIVL